jgi:hypothetical protein
MNYSRCSINWWRGHKGGTRHFTTLTSFLIASISPSLISVFQLRFTKKDEAWRVGGPMEREEAGDSVHLIVATSGVQYISRTEEKSLAMSSTSDGSLP